MRLFNNLFIFLLVGCGTGIIYGPASFDETQLDSDIHRVTFRGNQHPATGELCLLRCAEVCLNEGYSHFEVIDSETGSSIENIHPRFPFDRHYSLMDTFIEDLPFVAKTIRLFKSKPTAGFAYEARSIKTSLTSKYGIGVIGDP